MRWHAGMQATARRTQQGMGAAFFDAGGTEDELIAARAAEFDNFRAALKWALGGDGVMPAWLLALLALRRRLWLIWRHRAASPKPE